jgi:hypothetical protein
MMWGNNDEIHVLVRSCLSDTPSRHSMVEDESRIEPIATQLLCELTEAVARLPRVARPRGAWLDMQQYNGATHVARQVAGGGQRHIIMRGSIERQQNPPQHSSAPHLNVVCIMREQVGSWVSDASPQRSTCTRP